MKQIAVYTELKKNYELIQELKVAIRKNQIITDALYSLGNDEIKTYIDENYSEDHLEMLAQDIGEELELYEKYLERLYNQWKGEHYEEPLFKKLDSTIFDVDFMEWE